MSGGFSGISFGSLFLFINRLGERTPDGCPQTATWIIWALLIGGIMCFFIAIIIANTGGRKIRQKKIRPTIIHPDGRIQRF